MAKTTKKEFAWDKETTVKEIEVSKYEKRIVTVTELNGKEFVCVATHKKIKEEWKPVKNATFPMDVWKEIVEAMGDYELASAFGSTTTIEAPKAKKKAPAKTPTRKETDKAISNSLKGLKEKAPAKKKATTKSKKK